MSKLLFNNHEYTFKALLELSKKSPLYKSGNIVDLETGEEFGISNIDKYREVYIDELITKRHKENIIKNKDTKDRAKELGFKYLSDIINKEEMFEYLKILNQDKIRPNYNYDKGYIVVNLNKIPKNITDSDYGKFNKLLIFLSSNHKNKITHANGKLISKKDISNFLGYKNIEYLNKYLRKMKKLNLIDEKTFGGIKFLIINPAYAKKNMEIDHTIYKMFKNDLDSCLTEYQIKYLNMHDDNVEINSMIPISD